MKQLLFLPVIFLLFLMVTVFGVQAQKTKADTICYKSSMHCAGCENTIFEQLRFEKGVKDLKVDHVSNTVKVVFDGNKTSAESIAKVIVRKGYKADVITDEEYDLLTKPRKGIEVRPE